HARARHCHRQRPGAAVLFQVRHARPRLALLNFRATMTYLLRITVSPRGTGSHSRRFADQVAESILRPHAIGRVVLRDITASAVPCIDSAYVQAMLAHTSREASSGVAALLLSEQLIEELEAAHALLIDTPVHNYTVPAALKTWIDHVVRVGRTFKSTPAGKV